MRNSGSSSNSSSNSNKNSNKNWNDTETAFLILSEEIAVLLEDSSNPLAVCLAGLAASLEACYANAPSRQDATDIVHALTNFYYSANRGKENPL